MRLLLGMFCFVIAASAEAARLPLAFEANEGQWPPEVRFLARVRSGLVVLRADGASFSSPSGRPVQMSFLDATTSPRIQGLTPLTQTSSYFVGNDPSAWRTEVRAYSRVVYEDAYPGIDAVFYSSNNGELEYDFIVRPGSDPGSIRLRFTGCSVATNRGGDLLLRTANETIRMKRPEVYQTTGQTRMRIAGNYRVHRNGVVGFSVGKYDRSNDLIIDPVVLGFSTFLGGTDSDSATGIAIDADRNTYITGSTMSANFPIRGGIRGTIAGGRDVFVVKLNPAGDQILFSTFLGGSADETPRPLIAVDLRGDIYVGGSTGSADFPTTEGAPQRSFSGGASDAFAAKLRHDGSRLLFSTYLGGEAGDPVNGIAVDAMGDIYLGGSTFSSAFPTTPAAPQATRGGPRDAFVAKFRVDPPSLLYSTYLGGSDEDFGLGLAVDSAGAAYVTGKTLSTDYPTTAGAFQGSFAGAGTGQQREGDGFVTKIHPAGSSVVYSTYLGGVSGEIALSIGVDSAGFAYVTGLTYSRNFPTTAGSFQPQHGGGDADNFVTKIAPAGDRLIFSTFLGGSNSEQANAIAVDALGDIHVSGTTSASDFPTTSDALSRTRKGANDAFVTIISGDGSQLLYSTYLGGTAPSGGPQDNNWVIAVDGAGNTYTGGQTRSADFPVTPGAPQGTHSGLDDAYIVKFTAVRQRPEGELRVVPTAGPRTSVHLHNPRDFTIGGRFIFHPEGRSGSDADPTFDYFLGPRETIAISDLLPAMSQTGRGSIDLLAPTGQVPESVIRVFEESGEGTIGFSEELIRPSEALQVGTTGVLIAPATETARFDIGVRTLRDGATMQVTLRRSSGAVARTFSKTYEADFSEHRSAADFLGVTVLPDDVIAIRIDSGSVVIYALSADPTSGDSSFQLARLVDSPAGETRPYLLVAGSIRGALGSFFKTSLQLHNPASTAASGMLVFHRRDASGSDADPSLAYSLRPGETVSYDDLLEAMNRSGIGSIDLIPTSSPPPLSVARIYNDAGERGTTGTIEDQVSSPNVLLENDEAVLLAPPDPSRARFNVGIQALGDGATITFLVRNASGHVVKTVTRSFDPVFFTQIASPALLGTEFRGGESVTVRVDEGGAIVYGSINDNVTHDPTLQLLRRLE